MQSSVEQEINTQVAGTSQLSLTSLFGWVALCSFVFATLPTLPELAKGVQDQAPVRLTTSVTLVVAFAVLALRYAWARHWKSMWVLCLPPAITFGAIWWWGGFMPPSVRWAIVLCSMVLSISASFPFFVESVTSRAINRERHLGWYLVYRVVGGFVLFVLICGAFPSMFAQRLYFPAIVFGSLVGIWIGPYQAFAEMPKLRRLRVQGVWIRPIVVCGLLGAVLGPPIYEWLSNYVIGSYYFPSRYSPAIGICAAFLAGIVLLFMRKSSELQTDT